MSRPLTEVTGIGPSAAALLSDAGISSAEDLATASAETVAAVKGFGPARADRVIAAAKALLDAPETPAEEEATPEAEAAPKAKKKSKKDKGKKNKKKSKKDSKKKKKKKSKK